MSCKATGHLFHCITHNDNAELLTIGYGIIKKLRCLHVLFAIIVIPASVFLSAVVVFQMGGSPSPFIMTGSTCQ